MADPRQVERDHEVPGDTPTKSHRTRPALISRVDGSKQHKVREARTLLFQLVAPASCMPEWLIHCVNVLRVYIEQPVVLLVAKGRQRLAQDQAAAAAARAYGLAAAQGHAGAPSTLGFEHERGLGVPAGLGEAIRWYQRAGARATPMRTFQPRGHACRRQGMPSAQCPAGALPRPRCYRVAWGDERHARYVDLGVGCAKGLGKGAGRTARPRRLVSGSRSGGCWRLPVS